MDEVASGAGDAAALGGEDLEGKQKHCRCLVSRRRCKFSRLLLLHPWQDREGLNSLPAPSRCCDGTIHLFHPSLRACSLYFCFFFLSSFLSLPFPLLPVPHIPEPTFAFALQFFGLLPFCLFFPPSSPLLLLAITRPP
ncbi:hypothetical protein HDV57DRAFT_481346 [Trichoderma longibrachiatum]